MEKVYFVCDWLKDRKNSWSGTHLSIYQALQKHFDLVDFDISNRGLKSLTLILHARKMVKAYSKKDVLDIGVYKSKKVNKYLKKKIPKGTVVFQFDDCPDGSWTHSYIYRDLNYEYVKKYSQLDPHGFSLSWHDKKMLRIDEKIADEKKAYTNAQAVFTMGKWFAKELIAQGIPEDHVFHVGGGYNVDPSQIDYSKKSGNKILFVGRDFERKNGPLVVDAFKLALKQHNDLELYIAGPVNLTIDDPHIHVLGDCPYEKLVKYFNLCDIFVMPSKFEAYGLVFPEALTFGLPCIGRDDFEMPYFIEDGKTGYVLKHENAQDLANLMIKLIDDDVIKEYVRSLKSYYLKEYSWDTVAERMAKVIKNKEQEI